MLAAFAVSIEDMPKSSDTSRGWEMGIKDIMNRVNEQPARATETTQATPPGPQHAAPVRPARTVGPSTCIDASTELQGTLRCRETLRIDGRVDGAVHCDKNVIIGEEATVLAAIEASEVTVSGEVKGDITADRKITLAGTARVIGDLCTPGIVIEEGAKLEGRIMIGSDAIPEVKSQTERRSQPNPASASSGSKSVPKASPPPPSS
jgi:cytoskeletal protein CcmA (bactofilin family)